jgi:hypothetical protein
MTREFPLTARCSRGDPVSSGRSAAGELLVSGTDFVGEIDQLLTDDKFLEGECHAAQGRERG